ncbi:MAG: vitamin B12-dependent ribonucleotide reductase [Bacillota bacterium]|nr:vitamin B12-dependent ribonucleotide reductase [Bacillota bacterium]MDD3297744.1 vitamin B12-dependent ribonucleotide reductase [Bacillota bacterium]MDD4706683.1 vitamin B12-dependent ribonucleotide reductase [Bacillota bacterium]
MQLSDNALRVLERRYLTKNERGEPIETPEEMFRRVAHEIASAEADYNTGANPKELEETFYRLLTDLEFIPNSPTLMNAGKDLGQLSACFVLPVEDSMEGIFDAIKQAAIIHKSGGGTGFSFSRLRPAGATVNSTGGVASGPISFMKVFNAATEAVKQGGVRRGANMGILRVDHPDILEFIKCKRDNKDFTNFNISVAVTEEFMRAMETGEEYALVNPRDKSIVLYIDAREVFDLIVEMAWKNGEPGIIFIDRINEYNILKKIGDIESTNPCGEQVLLPYESCNLGSINLTKMVRKEGNRTVIDYQKLGKTVDTAVWFLDNVIDVNRYPLPQIEEATKGSRKIGLGVMGFADMLILLGIPYDSNEAVEVAEEVMAFINSRSKEKSAELAVAKGAFPFYRDSTYAGEGTQLRNATTTTIAPTGTISIIAGASSGIEPLFAISFIRNVMDKDQLPEVHPIFEETARKRGFYSRALMEEISRKGTIKDIKGVPEDVKRLFVTAHDISPEWHIRMQAAFQKHTDNAVSKTVNFPSHAVREDVRKVYLLAHKLGCKGVTIYRDKSREEQVLSIGGPEGEAETGHDVKGQTITPRIRPEITRGLTEKVKIGCGNLYITVNYDDNGICEVFTNLGRAGGCPSQSEATSRLISIALRSGISVEAIIEQLKGIRCHSTIRQRANGSGIKVLSCPDAIGKTIERAMKMNRSAGAVVKEGLPAEGTPVRDGVKAACPECGGMLEHESGCVVCPNCGFSRCG